MNMIYFLTFPFSGGSDSNIDAHKFNKGSLQSCTIIIINISLVDESQDIKALKHANTREWLALSGCENAPAPVKELMKVFYVIGDEEP
jgi:hypothetical protein